VKRKPLHVSLHVREPSVVDLTVGDRVQLDRVVPTPGPSQNGSLAERHGRLLDPGVTRLALPAGRYFFKTLSDANLRVVTGGVAAGSHANDKDGTFPDPLASPAPRGDERPGESPRFTIE